MRLGPIPTEHLKLIPQLMLARIHDMGPLSLQADLCRARAVEVAHLASLGLITSLDSTGSPSRQWRLTTAGLLALKGH